MVNLSVSESGDSKRLGYPRWQVNHAVLQVSAALLGQGASVSFGHDWRDDGVMAAVFSFARDMQAEAFLSAELDGGLRFPSMVNLLAWPDAAVLPGDTRQALEGVLHVEGIDLPADVSDLSKDALAAGPGTELYNSLRARALTTLREVLTERASARLCLGGATHNFAGALPGVLEEAWYAIRAGKPVFVSNILGGASGMVVAALSGESKNVPSEISGPSVDRKLLGSAWDGLRSIGLSSFSKLNHLSEEENQAMFYSRSLDQVIQLVLRGLSRQKPDQPS